MRVELRAKRFDYRCGRSGDYQAGPECLFENEACICYERQEPYIRKKTPEEIEFCKRHRHLTPPAWANIEERENDEIHVIPGDDCIYLEIYKKPIVIDAEYKSVYFDGRKLVLDKKKLNLTDCEVDCLKLDGEEMEVDVADEFDY